MQAEIKHTGLHAPGGHVEEVEGHPFLELEQHFCTVKFNKCLLD